jgi:effector-binding domain-containing protein
LFKIGDFSRLSFVTIKTLRYYDEIGLLKPVRVDKFTGYRYYAPEQLTQLNYIMALKDLGLSLDEIAVFVKDNLTPVQLRDIFILKKAELQQRVTEEQRRLDQVERLLKRIEQEGSMPNYQMQIKKLEPLLVAGIRQVIPTYADCGPMFVEVYRYLASQGAQPVGPLAFLMYDTEYKERDVDVEVAVPVSKKIAGSGRVKVYELPGIDQAVTTLHKGPYHGVTEAYTAIMSWCEANQYELYTPSREIYLTDPNTEKDPANNITEVQFPVRKGTA